MPCYTEPPPFAGLERRSAEHAVRILCEFVKQEIREDRRVPKEMLEWWKTHREIDAKIAKDHISNFCAEKFQSDGQKERYKAYLREASEADADVEMVTRMLSLEDYLIPTV